jgi:hypothetical protein
MSRRSPANVRRLLLTGVSVALLGAAHVAGQTAPAGKPAAGAPTGSWNHPRTPWGDPDLQGIWNNTAFNAVPLEHQSEEVLKERQRRSESPAARRAQGLGYDTNIWGEGARSGRGGAPAGQTHLIVDPPDGRLPPLTPEAQARSDARIAARRGLSLDEPRPGAWVEDITLWVRCISRGLPDAMFPRLYNNNYQILQIPGYVVILYEMIHDARIIPVDGRPHLPPTIRQWMGDPRGHWEGNTLVVETTNFTGNEFNLIPHGGGGNGTYLGAGPNLRLVERFTRLDADNVDYRFTLDDPKLYTRPWTGAIPLTRQGSPDQILEYACHEGNHSIVNILSGAYARDRAAGAGKP